jgi:hypothetical protein
MARQDVFNEITEMLGSVPGWLSALPDGILESVWGRLVWVMSDSELSAKDKVLVAYGAAAAIHCRY